MSAGLAFLAGVSVAITIPICRGSLKESAAFQA